MYAIADEHFNPVQTHFAGEVRKYGFSGIELYTKERVGECLFDDSFYDLCFSHICADKNSSNCLRRQATPPSGAPAL